MGETAVIPGQIVAVPAKSLLANNTAATDACGTVSWSAASTGDILAVQGDGTVAFQAPAAAGITGSTGSTDNAVLRADGAGGSTLQASGWIVPDIYTASPNATVNHLSMQATGASTNVSVSIVPKGTGAFSLAVPDGTSAGGNARGSNSIELQTSRNAATQVASGDESVLIGYRSTASGPQSLALGWAVSAVNDTGCMAVGFQSSASGRFGSVAIGRSCTASAQATVAVGVENTATATNSFAFGRQCNSTASQATSIGNNCTASAANSFACGHTARANRQSMFAFAAGSFATEGDVQNVSFSLRNKTTDGTTATTLFLDGSSAHLTIPAGKILYVMVHVLGSKSDGSAVASYMRQVCIKRVGNTTSLVGTVNTIGTDEAAGTVLAITADDTNEALDIAVTGIASETWRWVANVFGLELAFGS